MWRDHRQDVLVCGGTTPGLSWCVEGPPIGPSVYGGTTDRTVLVCGGTTDRTALVCGGTTNRTSWCVQGPHQDCPGVEGPPTGLSWCVEGPPTGPSWCVEGPPIGPSVYGGTTDRTSWCVEGPPTGPSWCVEGPPTGRPGVWRDHRQDRPGVWRDHRQDVLVCGGTTDRTVLVCGGTTPGLSWCGGTTDRTCWCVEGPPTGPSWCVEGPPTGRPCVQGPHQDHPCLVPDNSAPRFLRLNILARYSVVLSISPYKTQCAHSAIIGLHLRQQLAGVRRTSHDKLVVHRNLDEGSEAQQSQYVGKQRLTSPRNMVMAH